jgi:hypothetical protein
MAPRLPSAAFARLWRRTVLRAQGGARGVIEDAVDGAQRENDFRWET